MTPDWKKLGLETPRESTSLVVNIRTLQPVFLPSFTWDPIPWNQKRKVPRTLRLQDGKWVTGSLRSWGFYDTIEEAAAHLKRLGCGVSK